MSLILYTVWFQSFDPIAFVCSRFAATSKNKKKSLANVFVICICTVYTRAPSTHMNRLLFYLFSWVRILNWATKINHFFFFFFFWITCKRKKMFIVGIVDSLLVVLVWEWESHRLHKVRKQMQTYECTRAILNELSVESTTIIIIMCINQICVGMDFMWTELVNHGFKWSFLLFLHSHVRIK